jgi:hypothetical protein
MSDKNGKHGIGVPEVLGGGMAGASTALMGVSIAAVPRLNESGILNGVERTLGKNLNSLDVSNAILEAEKHSPGLMKKIYTPTTKEALIIGSAALVATGLTAWGINAFRNRNSGKEQEEPANPAKNNPHVQKIIASRANNETASHAEVVQQQSTGDAERVR